MDEAATIVSLCSNVFLFHAALFSPIPFRSCMSSSMLGYPTVSSSES